jgi:tyrosinase
MKPQYLRRSVVAGLAGGALLPFKDWFAREAFAQAATDTAERTESDQRVETRTRYDVNSAEGQKMLAIYGEAIARMTKLGDGDPCSWTFQWYTHFVKGSTSKAAEISRIYGAGSSPHKALAEATWSTCQAHMGPPQDELAFFPWHRMYVLYFESIVRRISGRSEFTLPYWNYSAASSRAMPAAFREQNTPFFRPSRNSGPNSGAQIPAAQVALTALSETTFGPSGAAPGFGPAIDFGIHGNVHVWVGNGQGMGSVPWAAYDPIFWMHHCNIDRLWASWNKAGRPNPGGSWLTEEFVFANDRCERVVAKNGEVDQIEKLHYTYDRFEPVPGTARVAAAAAVTPTVRLQSFGVQNAAAVSGPIALGASPVGIQMRAPASAAAVNAQSFAARMASMPPEAKLYMVLKDAAAAEQPGVVYDVYLETQGGGRPAPDDPHYLGAINFFAAVGMEGMAGGVPRTFSLDVTRQARALAAQNLIPDNLTVFIAPVGSPNEAARPVIGEMQMVEQ